MKDLKEIFQEFEAHIMKDEAPSKYFNGLLKEEWFKSTYPFTLLSALVNVEQSPKHHPEGNVWNHTMMVLDNAAGNRELSDNPRAFMWAALLHDIGKAPTTRVRNGRITSYDHDKIGEDLTVNFLQCFGEDENFIYEVSKLVRWHMQILFVNKDLPYGNIKGMMEETSVSEIALLGKCDRLGRGGLTPEKISEEENNIEVFVEKCEIYRDKFQYTN